MTAAAKVPHVHAGVIKAWADDPSLAVEWRYGGNKWSPCDAMPAWDLANEYRVKPALPARVYPVTGMTVQQLVDVAREAPGQYLNSYIEIAHAALRHAIDAGTVLTLADHQAAIAAFGVRLRDAASGREMAIVEAVMVRVQRSASNTFMDSGAYGTLISDYADYDLAAIIAKVPTC